MARLIDADILIKHLEEVQKTANELGNSERVDDLAGVIALVKAEKTVAERQHGEWENCGGVFCARCSVCKKVAYETIGNFCPNCGADMREEGEAE